eukprot:scaffold129816_cov39-Phaeocystis_antarctica.AAC.1
MASERASFGTRSVGKAPNGRQKSSLKKLALPPVSSELGNDMSKGCDAHVALSDAQLQALPGVAD